MIIRTCVLFVLMLSVTTVSQAQDLLRPQPKFWFGASGAANFNFYTGTTQQLNEDTKAPSALHNGFGVGPYASLLMEYRPQPVFGLMLNAAYDNRSAIFKGVMAPCNCPEVLTSRVSYITLEPSLRVAPFSNAFYVFAGPAISYNIGSSFTYTQKDQPDVNGKFSDMHGVILSGQVGAGYEIPLSPVSNPMQVSLSPFISYHPYFGQMPRSVESMSLTTIRVGIALKFGKVRVKPTAENNPAKTPSKTTDGAMIFSVDVPASIPANRTVKETFPIRDYIFFDEGSTEIPNRYIRLNKEEATNFKEGLFQDPAPKDKAGRSDRQLSAYYNILNILGDRMRKNPDARISLLGSSAGSGPEKGKSYAESVKNYLTKVFGIKGSRIETEGRDQPVLPSLQPGGNKEVAELKEGDRRVDIVSSYPDLLAPLKISTIQDDPLDSRITFKAESGKNENIKSWNLDLTDEKGTVQHFGPFDTNEESVSGNDILGDRKEGDFSVLMTGKTKEGNTIERRSTLHLQRDKAPKEAGLRFSILFDFNQSKAVQSYDKFLTETVAPLITDGATIIIHGHSDNIGDKDHNMQLSQDRANEVQQILEKALQNSGKTGVKYKTYGFGADAKTAPFENNLPEERFYNRTVIIDIIPKK